VHPNPAGASIRRLTRNVRNACAEFWRDNASRHVPMPPHRCAQCGFVSSRRYGYSPSVRRQARTVSSSDKRPAACRLCRPFLECRGETGTTFLRARQAGLRWRVTAETRTFRSDGCDEGLLSRERPDGARAQAVELCAAPGRTLALNCGHRSVPARNRSVTSNKGCRDPGIGRYRSRRERQLCFDAGPVDGARCITLFQDASPSAATADAATSISASCARMGQQRLARNCGGFRYRRVQSGYFLATAAGLTCALGGDCSQPVYEQLVQLRCPHRGAHGPHSAAREVPTD